MSLKSEPASEPLHMSPLADSLSLAHALRPDASVSGVDGGVNGAMAERATAAYIANHQMRPAPEGEGIILESCFQLSPIVDSGFTLT